MFSGEQASFPPFSAVAIAQTIPENMDREDSDMIEAGADVEFVDLVDSDSETSTDSGDFDINLNFDTDAIESVDNITDDLDDPEREVNSDHTTEFLIEDDIEIGPVVLYDPVTHTYPNFDDNPIDMIDVDLEGECDSGSSSNG